MKALTFLLILFLQSVALHAQNTQAKLLEHAYKTHSKKELKQFFDNWHKEIPPISDSEFNKLDTMQKEAYRVFEAFFNDNNIFYKNYKYVIIPNRIGFGISKKKFTTISDSTVLDKSELNDSIINFRPSMQNSKIPVYLTSEYLTILDTFAGVSYGDFNFDPNKEEIFLTKMIAITSSPILGDDWNYYTLPHIYSIELDKTFNAVIIEFGEFRSGGLALLKRENGGWKIIKIKIIWIQ